MMMMMMLSAVSLSLSFCRRRCRRPAPWGEFVCEEKQANEQTRKTRGTAIWITISICIDSIIICVAVRRRRERECANKKLVSSKPYLHSLCTHSRTAVRVLTYLWIFSPVSEVFLQQSKTSINNCHQQPNFNNNNNNNNNNKNYLVDTASSSKQDTTGGIQRCASSTPLLQQGCTSTHFSKATTRNKTLWLSSSSSSSSAKLQKAAASYYLLNTLANSKGPIV